MAFIKTHKTTTEALTDEALVAAILVEPKLVEKRKLQEMLYNRYAEVVYFKCFSIVKSKETAKDLTHDIIIKFFLNLHKFSGRASFHTWVIVVAYNHCMNWLKKEKRIQVETIDNYPAHLVADDNGEAIARKILEELQLNQLERVFKKIKEIEKLVLLMRYQDGLSIKNIASVLEIGESAVKMRLKRGRDHLVQLVNKEADE